jgi:hypothetical protein
MSIRDGLRPVAMSARARVDRFGPGERMPRPQAGDFVLIRRDSWIGKVIHWVQRLRFPEREDRQYLHWTHAAFVTAASGRIIEAGSRGVVAQTLEKYDDIEYHYVHVNATDSARWAAVLYAESCVGQSYGRLDFLALGLAALTGRQLGRRDPRTQNCVALVVRALERMRGSFGREPLDMMPADLAKHYDVTP